MDGYPPGPSHILGYDSMIIGSKQKDNLTMELVMPENGANMGSNRPCRRRIQEKQHLNL